jgi:hypothetical protein
MIRLGRRVVAPTSIDMYLFGAPVLRFAVDLSRQHQ